MLGMMMSRLCEKLCMYRYAGDAPADTAPQAEGDISWELFTPQTIKQYFADDPKWARRFTYSLNANAVGVLVKYKGDWASYGWFSTPGGIRPPHIPRQLKTDAFWFYHGHTKARFRQRGLFRVLIRQLLSEAYRSNPAPEILVDVEVRNHQSRRAVAEAGFTECGMLNVCYLWLPKLIRYPLACNWRKSEPHPAMDT
jgi:hypothetical protein